ncbi:MAG: GAF domain-containing protein [Anaerolineae bacterium]|nr:GAF domain-containing protein [Anaerolineae bacterium]
MQISWQSLFPLRAYTDPVERQRASNFYWVLGLGLGTMAFTVLVALWGSARSLQFQLTSVSFALMLVFLLLPLMLGLWLTRRGRTPGLGVWVFAIVGLAYYLASVINPGAEALNPFQDGALWLMLVVVGVTLRPTETVWFGVAAAAAIAFTPVLHPGIEAPSNMELSLWVVFSLLMTTLFTFIGWRIAHNLNQLGAVLLTRETQRRLALIQTSTLVSQRIFTRLDLETLLAETVEQIRARFSDIYHAQVFLIEGERTARLRASTGEVGQQLIARQHALEVGSQSVIGRVTQSGQMVLVNDTSQDPVHRVNELLPETRTELALPLRSRHGIIGALDVQSTRLNAFSSEDMEALQLLADQIAIAVDNARLFTEAQEEARRARALARASQITSRIGVDFARGLDELLRTMALPGNYTQWWVGILDADGHTLRRSTSHVGATTQLLLPEVIDLRHENNALAEAVRSKAQVIVNHFENHPLLGHIPAAQREMFGKHLALPILDPLDNEVRGALLVGRLTTDINLDMRDIELARTLASQISTALENRRLFSQVAQDQQTLQSVLGAMPVGVLVTDNQGKLLVANEQ